ncbi:MAG TPA: CusA/CzcA family heavy metal efflux RND transporter [Bacteroidia bacterium]|nr:CusA/CzcA family heavy metal efflux RND transporter [Bacteroidia bacterium]
MVNFMKGIIAFSLKNKLFILFMTGLTVVAGLISYFNTPVEAFPDVTNTQIEIITLWPGRSCTEVEKFVTIPIEIAMNSVQKKTIVRSISMYGLSDVIIIFDDGVDDPFARQQVNNLIHEVELPEGLEPEVLPPGGPTGEVYRYTVQSPKRNIRDLTTIQNWTIDRNLRAVPGVADIVTFGGDIKTYEIQVDPHLLAKYDLTPLDVYDAVSKSNINVGGDIIEKNEQAYVVRGIGLLTSIPDIENIIIKENGGTPILVKNVATVVESALPRLGSVALDTSKDVVEGVVIMRKGENPGEFLHNLKEKIKQLNNGILPPDVKIVPFYDRDKLIGFCTHTVLHNLFEGIILVTLVVFVFMADWRTTVTVAVIVPMALLFAFICLRIMGMTANLLSMGAIDFGIIIDGAVVMVEGIFVALDHKAHAIGMDRFNRLAKLGIIRRTGAEMGKAILFSKIIILTALIPIFSFQKVEGKMFSPLAFTLGFALLGALIFTLTLVPVMSSMLLKKNVREKNNPFTNGITKLFIGMFSAAFRRKTLSLALALIMLAGSIFCFRFLGTEFLPDLNEGALWVESSLPLSVSITESRKIADKMRGILMKFDEVDGVLSQTGRPADGTDPDGFYSIQCQVNLKPKDEWKTEMSSDELIDSMDAQLRQIPGVIFNYSQPIIDNVHEAVAGMNADIAVKVYGPNLKTIDSIGRQIIPIMKNVRGIEDVGLLKTIGQPELLISLDQARMKAYGVSTGDAQAVVEMAIGGKAATQLYDEDRRFDIRIRYAPQYRSDETQIGNLMVPTLTGGKVPLKAIATIKLETGDIRISRDNNTRFGGVKFTIRDRDMGSAIKEAQDSINAKLKLPEGYHLEWAGEYENQVRATKRLTQVVPISLVIIFVILFIAFSNIKDAVIVIVTVPFSLIGGILALLLTHTIFGISAGIGFIALFGVCVQNGVILISVFKKNLANKMSLRDAITAGVASRVRPVVMTAMMAAIGLLPAAISTGIGSETQKPLAIVIIGGLVSATVLTLLVLPIIFERAYKRKHSELGI